MCIFFMYKQWRFLDLFLSDFRGWLIWGSCLRRSTKVLSTILKIESWKSALETNIRSYFLILFSGRVKHIFWLLFFMIVIELNFDLRTSETFLALSLRYSKAWLSELFWSIKLCFLNDYALFLVGFSRNNVNIISTQSHYIRGHMGFIFSFESNGAQLQPLFSYFWLYLCC